MLIRSMTLLLFLLATGCVAGGTFLVPDPTINAVWPPAPNEPRIRFVRALTGSDDIAAKKGTLGRLFDTLTGDTSWHATFSTPYGIAYDGESALYVADPSAGLIHRFDLQYREAVPITRVGDLVLANPVGLALDAEHNLYIADSLKMRVVKIDARGGGIGELTPPGGFKRPAGIAVSPSGEKFVVDVLAQKVYVFDRNDKFRGEFPNSGEAEPFESPTSVAVGKDGTVYVTDSLECIVKIFNSQGTLIGRIGQPGDSPGSFARPKGVAVDSDGNVYVVDGSADNFQIFDKEGHLLLFVGKNGRGPGDFSLPSGIFIDSRDRIYVADTYNHRVQIFQYLKKGTKE